MMHFQWLDPECRPWLAAHGLGTLDDALARRGEVVSEGNRGRFTERREIVERRDASNSPKTTVVYVKQETSTRWKDLAAHAIAGRGWWTKARVECEVLRHLHARGIGCPRVLACFQSGWPRPRACLVLAELAGFQSLPAALAASRARPQLFAQLGREIARLHAAGVGQPDLYSNHILAAPAGNEWRIAFLDFQRSHIGRVARGQRIRDLAALRATLTPRLMTADEWTGVCRAYLDVTAPTESLDAWQAAIAARAERLLHRRKIWEIRESDTAEHAAVQRLEPIDGGRMWIDRQFRELLATAGLTRFEAVMQTTEGRQLRALRDRENWRLELHDTHHRAHGAYLKKHHIRSLGTRLRALVGAGPGETAGRVEAENVTRLGRGGIAAMRLLAFGEQLHDDGRLESFVLTEELTGYAQLDHFLRARFPVRAADRATPRDKHLAQLIEDVAAVAAKFHQLGYNHRDLYCCHFFIREPAAGQFQVNLIDLQRVEHRHWRRGRWLVKDLAQLAYSAPRERISCTQKLAFMKSYLGVKKLRPRDKRFIRRILLKQRLMEMTQGMHP